MEFVFMPQAPLRHITTIIKVLPAVPQVTDVIIFPGPDPAAFVDFSLPARSSTPLSENPYTFPNLLEALIDKFTRIRHETKNMLVHISHIRITGTEVFPVLKGESVMKKKPSLPVQIFLALVAGIVLGLILSFVPGGDNFTKDYLKPFGDIFVNLLKFIVVPVVLLSMIDGILSMDDMKKVGSVGWKTVATVFLAACANIQLTIGQMVLVVVTATLASIGTAGVSGAGMVMLAMVLEAIGLPVDYIGLIVAVDRLFDMGRTCLNVTGDIACSICVTKWESKKVPARK